MISSEGKITKVLIANRGEIAIRAIKACRALGLSSLAIYSAADCDARHVFEADEAVCIGPAQSALSYLMKEAIIHVAIQNGCDAIYPGYGFLSENPSFVELCETNGIIFIGPSAKVIRKMGDKATARQIAVENNVPVVTGSSKAFNKVHSIIKEATTISFPLLLKARAGGGGRGMQIVTEADDLEKAFVRCSVEAKKAFGDDYLYIERYFHDIRHLEVQILGDGKGNVLSFGERDCSLQRRHQKLIEEAPASIIEPKTRAALLLNAETLASSVNYKGAGTVEFIYDPKSKEFFFIEMNTRIQVEHPVTEMLFDIDFVKAQIEIAQGKALKAIKYRIKPLGHAIEFRLNAEDWRNDFSPSPGRLSTWKPPKLPGVRIDTAVYEGYSVKPYYDSMIAKLIVHAKNRSEAINLANDALRYFAIGGIKSTLGFHRQLIYNNAFVKNEVSTRWVDQAFMSSRE